MNELQFARQLYLPGKCGENPVTINSELTSNNPKIIHGREALPGQFPWQVKY